jgi:hypothetical protein
MRKCLAAEQAVQPQSASRCALGRGDGGCPASAPAPRGTYLRRISPIAFADRAELAVEAFEQEAVSVAYGPTGAAGVPATA